MERMNLSQEINTLREHYLTRLFCSFPQLVLSEVNSLLQTTKNVAMKRVNCGKKEISWQQQEFELKDELFEFFNSPETRGVVEAIIGQKTGQTLMCWTSIYEEGEYINPHKDRAGLTQLLICLQVPSFNNGGELVLKTPKGEERLHLKEGEGVLFEATKLEHYTTPLTNTNQKRIVAVGRYFPL